MLDVTSVHSSASPRDLSRRWRAHQKGMPGGPPDASIGFAGSFTVEPLADYTGALLLGRDCAHPHVAVANYNQLVRACLNPKLEFGTNDLEMIVLLCRLEDLANPVAVGEVSAALDTLYQAIRQLRETFDGTIVIGLPPRPRSTVEHLVSFARSSPLEVLWYDALARFSALTQELPNTYSLDLEAVIAELGEGASLDYRKEILYRLPYSEEVFVRLARQVVRIYGARRSEPKKCIVLDCDNTLWGGIIGEDGVGGVQLSDDHPGRAYLEFQRQLKVLRESGVFLALCSKNNPDDVAEMFEKHASMVIRMEDISISRINWRPKSENLKAIADELNIGIDSLVFIDDNPFEIEEVRAHAPGVTCIQVPEDIVDLPPLFRSLSYLLDRLEITADDRGRVGMMRQEMQRRELSQKLTEVEFLVGLGIEVRIFEPTEADHARVTQLINKTNQFNLTTKRYSAEEVAEMLKAADTDLFCANVADRFGDYGLVGVAIVRHAADGADIDSLLMSCRVLGRGVESALVAHAIALAHQRGAKSIAASFMPTRKNAMVANLFDLHGFQIITELPSGARTYRRSTDAVQLPTHLRVVGGRGSELDNEKADRGDVSNRPTKLS